MTAPRAKPAQLRLTIIAIVVIWTYLYNVLIKEQGPIRALFEIIDTISDDFVVGTLLTVGVGLGIVVVFSITKLYTQIAANIYSFRILEDLAQSELRRGRYRTFLKKLLTLEDQPLPDSAHPTRCSTVVFSFTFVYAMSWIYVILFSEALFFVSWSAGVDLPVTERNLILMPTLALAIPFSARVMAFARYPYAQDYADFMPGAVFVLLLVAAMGLLFESDKQEFFLERVVTLTPEEREQGIRIPNTTMLLLRNGAFLAFIPVFFEAIYWLSSLGDGSNGPDEAPVSGSPQDDTISDEAVKP